MIKQSMHIKPINAENAPQTEGGYSQALEVGGTTRRLYISGQIPATQHGNVPETFEDQAALVWENIIAQLHAAGMDVENLVKVTTYLSDRKFSG
ncbi:MAG: RidA family protein, partial [Desulfobulbia bacterium]